MRKTVAVLGMTCLMAVGCATVNDGDGVRRATWKAIGSEQIAWSTRNASSLPAGMDSLVSLTNLTAHVDTIPLVSPSEATAVATYRYAGKFTTDGGERNGVLTVQRKLRFTKSGSDWVQSGAEEIARSNDWSGPGASKQASK